MHEWYLDEQIVMEQPHHPILLTGLGLELVIRVLAARRLLGQIVRIEKLHEVFHISDSRPTGRLTCHHRMEFFNRSGTPVFDHLIDRPFDLKIPAANGIDNGPSRHAVGRRGAAIELEVRAYRWELAFLWLGLW